ncbi:hypothetical protein [Lentzea kentuckyensis]|nr:hypothetical protein [Lentzea kentuckyensis]
MRALKSATIVPWPSGSTSRTGAAVPLTAGPPMTAALNVPSAV